VGHGAERLPPFLRRVWVWVELCLCLLPLSVLRWSLTLTAPYSFTRAVSKSLGVTVLFVTAYLPLVVKTTAKNRASYLWFGRYCNLDLNDISSLATYSTKLSFKDFSQILSENIEDNDCFIVWFKGKSHPMTCLCRHRLKAEV
jgi:hypothetical protein